MGKRDEMRRAIDRQKKAPKVDKPPPVAAAATGEKKVNPRSAAARDARARARGRLPHGTMIETRYIGAGKFEGWLSLLNVHCEHPEENVMKVFKGVADGHFRLSEELDVQFWEWLAKPGDENLKKELVFDEGDHKPEPMPKEKSCRN